MTKHEDLEYLAFKINDEGIEWVIQEGQDLLPDYLTSIAKHLKESTRAFRALVIQHLYANGIEDEIYG